MECSFDVSLVIILRVFSLFDIGIRFGLAAKSSRFVDESGWLLTKKEVVKLLLIINRIIYYLSELPFTITSHV